MIPYKFKAYHCQQGYIWQCQYMAYGTVTVYLTKPQNWKLYLRKNEIVQLTCCKHPDQQKESNVSLASHNKASSRWKLDIARRLAFASRSRTKKATYSAQQRLHKTECHSALDRLDFERFASQPMPQNS